MGHAGQSQYEPLRPDTLLTIDEAARYLRLSRGSVFRLLRAGDLRFVRVGKRRRIEPDELRRFLDAGRISGSQHER